MTERKNVLRQVLSKFKSLSRYINEEAEISKIAKEMTESFKLLYSRTHNDKYLTYMRTLNECIISTMSFEDALDSLNASELKGSGADLINKAIPLYKNIKIDYDTFLKAVEFYDLNND